MMKKIIYILILFLFSTLLFSNNAELDSLKHNIKISTGTDKVDAINLLSKAYWEIDPEITMEYCNEAMKLALKIGYEKGRAKAISNIGGGYYYLGDFEQAIKYFKESLEIRLKIGDKMEIITALNNIAIVYEDMNQYNNALEYYHRSLEIEEKIKNKDGIAGVLCNIGIVYQKLSNYNRALEYFIKSLRIYEEIENKNAIASTQGNIGLIYGNLTNYDKALEYHLKALNIYKETNDTFGLPTTLCNIGSIYDDIGNYDMALKYYLEALEMEEELGDIFGVAGSLNNIGIIYDDLGKFDKALEYYLRSLNLYEEIGNNNGIADVSNNIGVVYDNMENNSKALKYLLKSLEGYRKIGRKKGIAATLNNIGKIYYKTSEYDKALQYLKQALKLAKEIQVRDLEIEIYERFADIHSAKKEYKIALDYYKMYSMVKDSIFSKERMEIISGMETTYEVQLLLEEQEKEIELLQKDNEIYKLKTEKQKLTMLLLYFGIIILLVLAFVVYYRYKLNKKATLLLEKLVAERTRDLSETNIKLKKEILEREQLQGQLIRSERLAGIGELAAGIAHEIRNPLGNISSSAQICINKYKPTGEIKQFLGIIQEDSKKANMIIKGLLDFANPREVKLKADSVSKIIKKVIASVNARCQENKIKIINKCSPELPKILMDTKWIEQAFLNLILNAIQSMPGGGDLTIQGNLEKDKKHLTIIISDIGVGISRKNLAKIFDPFFTTREDGVGLGLSLCHQIIADHNGQIHIESEVNKGTRVIISLPIP